jgi:formylglycine-generating enzyme required for sulfatase activity
MQLGTTADDFGPCGDGGQGCADVFAASVPFATASASRTWFQAQQACTNSRKRLPTNAEWQAAVAGTPDPGPDDFFSTCTTNGFGKSATGSRSACVSSHGVFDMVGNVAEMVADWVPRSTSCSSWDPAVSPTDDVLCLNGADTNGEPAGLIRGGAFSNGTAAGPHDVVAIFSLSHSEPLVGFRCAR